MGEQIAAARNFPFQAGAQAITVGCDQQQVGLRSKMFCRGLAYLRRGGKVDKAIAPINGRSVITAGALGLFPCCPLADFVDHWQVSTRPAAFNCEATLSAPQLRSRQPVGPRPLLEAAPVGERT